MSVLTYIRRVLKLYASGDRVHLAETLFTDFGHDPTPQDKQLDALISGVENDVVAISQLLAGGRMLQYDVDPETEELWISRIKNVFESVGGLWAGAPTGVDVPSKSDLIEIGVVNLVLDRLENGVDRISSLDLISLLLPESLKHLQSMFSEAHFNYLLGNRTAVAIMCRALLEEALKDKAPGNLTIDGDRKTLEDRLEEAKANGWLDSERTASAREIIKAGNMAAHDSAKLSRYSDSKIEEILLSSRKILADLYS